MSSPTTDSDHEAVLDDIFETLAELAPEIRASLPGRRTKSTETNPSGETQMEADAYADELLEEALGAIDGVGFYASEEQAEPLDHGEGVTVALDPLDGSSNLKPNSPMGTIIAVYEGELPAGGDELLASGFVLFGPIMTMSVARNGTLTEYMVENGESEVITESVQLPEEPTVYGMGGRAPDWTPGFSAFIDEVEDEYKLRYGGSMVADVNQVLTYGGIFSYPALQSSPNGKLRLEFEGIPMAYIIECAGGASSDGTQSILDVEATEVHQRVPVHLGNEQLIDRVEAHLVDE
ncbi:fructose-1,6-bisphosphatase I [Halohasta litchfieldiae]|jgi:fructose-1,6-bisphosphatase I|uniref:Fructose-1,6-bisphosphatase class 1 n=1 Tax=Halohasta litchfieldiae TaxID=1073996 RepID=A0A1H6SET8_9EURY|nr:class 1 fructose-bisphosphatase [Halohasta litchfieldiae]ATW89935.1 fructose-1,6-bisphosphatase I [Halohasta litchfieldiae]SEI66421.1 D-fructose 1,6-bisphosphatase [Halohasta litchfieldiae]